MLTPAIDRYLELRRALGHKLHSAEDILRGFARLSDERSESYVTVRTALEWASRARTARQRASRIRVIIGLARFLHAEDPRHEIPPPETVPLPPRPSPYIFSPEEIRRLGAAAARLGREGSLRPLMFNTLFNLLAVTGLRISEALSLRLGDLTSDGLFIRDTKFHKSRIVCLHETATAALERYVQRRLQVPTTHDQLFISQKRTPLCYKHARWTFLQLCFSVGIQGPPSPRLHDLRHTAAVRALEACPGSREQVTPHMLALSTYLGHGSLQGTFWYLHSTPQLMSDIATAGGAWIRGDQS